MTSVHTTTRKGSGVSPRPCPLGTMAKATQLPIASGRNSAHRLLMSAPATRATARMRMMVMAEIVPANPRGVQLSIPPKRCVFRASDVVRSHQNAIPNQVLPRPEACSNEQACVSAAPAQTSVPHSTEEQPTAWTYAQEAVEYGIRSRDEIVAF